MPKRVLLKLVFLARESTPFPAAVAPAFAAPPMDVGRVRPLTDKPADVPPTEGTKDLMEGVCVCNPKERAEVVMGGKSLGQVWFPLPLFLNQINYLMGIWAPRVAYVSIKLQEILCDFYRQLLEVVNPFQSTKSRDMH